MSSFPLLSICVRKMNKFKFLIVHALLSQHELVSQDTVSSCMIFPNELTRRNEKRRREEQTSRGEGKNCPFSAAAMIFSDAKRRRHKFHNNHRENVVKCAFGVRTQLSTLLPFFFLLFASTHSHPVAELYH